MIKILLKVDFVKSNNDERSHPFITAVSIGCSSFQSQYSIVIKIGDYGVSVKVDCIFESFNHFFLFKLRHICMLEYQFVTDPESEMMYF